MSLPSKAKLKEKKKPEVSFRKNAKGGFLVTGREVRAIFETLDTEKKGVISLYGLRHKLTLLMPGFAPRDCASLFAGSSEISELDLLQLLEDNDMQKFDPVQSVFDSLLAVPPGALRDGSRYKAALTSRGTNNKQSSDSSDESNLDVLLLADIFEAMGMGHLSSEELSIVLSAGDFDGDGALGLSDFRKFVDLTETLTQHHTTAAQREYLKGTGADPFSAANSRLGESKLATESRKLVHKSLKMRSKRESPEPPPPSDNNRFLASIIGK